MLQQLSKEWDYNKLFIITDIDDAKGQTGITTDHSSLFFLLEAIQSIGHH